MVFFSRFSKYFPPYFSRPTRDHTRLNSTARSNHTDWKRSPLTPFTALPYAFPFAICTTLQRFPSLISGTTATGVSAVLSPPTANRARPADPEPTAQVLPVATGSSCFSDSWLQFLKVWSLRESRYGSGPLPPADIRHQSGSRPFHSLPTSAADSAIQYYLALH